MIKTEEEYKSIVKLTDFLVDMTPVGHLSQSLKVLFRMIMDWEKNIPEPGEDVNIPNSEEISNILFLPDEPVRQHTYILGDKSKGLCPGCYKLTNTTLKRLPDGLDVPYSFVCDECDSVVAYLPFDCDVQEQDTHQEKLPIPKLVPGAWVCDSEKCPFFKDSSKDSFPPVCFLDGDCHRLLKYGRFVYSARCCKDKELI